MNGRETVNRLMRRYGMRANLFLPDGWYSTCFYCFLQPLRYKNKMYLEGINTEIGFAGQGYYLYIGPAEHDPEKAGRDVRVKIGDEEFTVTHSEKMYFGEEAVYIWAVLARVVREAEE